MIPKIVTFFTPDKSLQVELSPNVKILRTEQCLFINLKEDPRKCFTSGIFSQLTDSHRFEIRDVIWEPAWKLMNKSSPVGKGMIAGLLYGTNITLNAYSGLSSSGKIFFFTAKSSIDAYNRETSNPFIEPCYFPESFWSHQTPDISC